MLGPLLQEGAQRQPPFDAVVTSSAEPQNVVKVLLARWLGRPVLEPGWVEACCSAGELQPMAGKLAVLEERPPCQAVAGKRVYLHGQQLRKKFALLLQYAGRTAFCAADRAECLGVLLEIVSCNCDGGASFGVACKENSLFVLQVLSRIPA